MRARVTSLGEPRRAAWMPRVAKRGSSRAGVRGDRAPGARRFDGRGSVDEDVRRRLDGTICGQLANARFLPARVGSVCAPRASRGSRENNSLRWRKKPVANSGETDGRAVSGWDRTATLGTEVSRTRLERAGRQTPRTLRHASYGSDRGDRRHRPTM